MPMGESVGGTRTAQDRWLLSIRRPGASGAGKKGHDYADLLEPMGGLGRRPADYELVSAGSH